MRETSAGTGGGPVVVDEWTVVLWADGAVSEAAIAQIVALVDAGLTTETARLSLELAATSRGPGAQPRVEVVAHGP